ncbi:MAG: hypothetical protein GY773_26130, partial [Actinomycetia bacterium]|nr:hypothetical protein [Actinomycetes bacterium]
LLVTIPEFAEVPTGAERIVIDPTNWDARIPKAQLALVLLAAAAQVTDVVSAEALRAAAEGPFEADNINAIEAGLAISPASRRPR